MLSEEQQERSRLRQNEPPTHDDLAGQGQAVQLVTGTLGFVDIGNSGPLGYVTMAEGIQIQVNGEQRGCQADATGGGLTA